MFLRFNSEYTIKMPSSVTSSLTASIIKRGGIKLWNETLQDLGKFSINTTDSIHDELKLVVENTVWKFFAYLVFFDEETVMKKCGDICQCVDVMIDHHFLATSNNDSGRVSNSVNQLTAKVKLFYLTVYSITMLQLFMIT